MSGHGPREATALAANFGCTLGCNTSHRPDMHLQQGPWNVTKNNTSHTKSTVTSRQSADGNLGKTSERVQRLLQSNPIAKSQRCFLSRHVVKNVSPPSHGRRTHWQCQTPRRVKMPEKNDSFKAHCLWKTAREAPELV